MPVSTIARDHPDRVLPVARIGEAIVQLVKDLPEEADVSENDREQMDLETRYAELDHDAVEHSYPPGEPSVFACPACGGVLWTIDDGDTMRFRCRVGHAFTADGVLEEEAEEVDRALWAAFRALHERADLANRSAQRLGARGAERTAERFHGLAREALDQAELIRTILLERDADVDGG
jgi:two-component system chemotaxis response regulator CheB